MATAAQLNQYCLDHHFTLTQPTTHWSLHMPSFSWTLVGDVLVAFVAFEIGHYGLSAVYSWIKSKVSSAPQTTTTPTTTPAA